MSDYLPVSSKTIYNTYVDAICNAFTWVWGIHGLSVLALVNSMVGCNMALGEFEISPGRINKGWKDAILY